MPLKSNNVSLRCGASLLLLSLLPLQGVIAEEAQDQQEVTTFEEIVVTARRRSESLQDVPIAVSVLTSQDIARAGIESVGDFASLVPNVSFGNALNLGTNYLTIRGQTQSQYAPPPAAIVVDGVLTISPLQFNVDEFDLQQIEVLKGPQGAIYGKNAIAGAINITTRKPGEEFKGRLLAGYARGDEWKAKASLSGPVVEDKLYILGGISYTDRRGQVQNITTGTYFDKFEDLTTRLRVVATPSDDIELDLKYTYSDTKGYDPNYITSRSGDPSISSDPLDSNRPGSNPRKLHDLSGKLNWETDFATATLTLAYVNVEESLDEELDYSPVDFLAATQEQDVDGFSQEIRFTSPAESELTWMVGAYHVKSEEYRAANLYIDLYYLGLAPEPTGANFLLNAGGDYFDYETWSGFGQVGYDVTPEFNLSFDLRYDDESITRTALDSSQRKASFSKWQPKGTITYKPADELTFYASVGQGFRSGDFNASTATFGDPLIRAETATNYEIGAKTVLFDNRLILNAALFQTDLKDGQFKLFDAVGTTNVGVNIDKTRIRGFEVETALQITDNLRLNASIGYVNPEILSFTPPAGFAGNVEDYIGNRPPRTPKITLNLGLDLDVPITDGISAFFRPDYRYLGSYYWDPQNTYKRPAENLLNLRFGLRDAEDEWTVSGYVKNALNEKITSDFAPFAMTGLPTGADVYFPVVDAVYGIELKCNF